MYYFLFYDRNSTKMRQSYDLPKDDGSRRSRCPPSHHEMALTPYYAQASARAPRPPPPSTHSPVLPGKVSPHHQQGSTMPSAAPAASPSHHLVSFASMGGGSPNTRPHDRSYGSMAPSPATTDFGCVSIQSNGIIASEIKCYRRRFVNSCGTVLIFGSC